jgi:CIC family chloride channel protein
MPWLKGKVRPRLDWVLTRVRGDIALRPLALWLAAVLVGIIAGLGAVVFRALIAIFHNLFFLAKFSTYYDANVHTLPGPYGPFVILAPAVGAVFVALLVKNFAPEAKGHGVPEVMDAIYYDKAVIRPIVALVKSLASAISIGSGGSVGREGPIIQIGAGFGSTLGQLLRLSLWQRATLIAAGTGAGIAATFNTPVGGMLFAAEMTMPEVSARTLVPVAIATATATYVGQLFFGAHPSFVIPAFEAPNIQLMKPWILVSYVGLGVLMGLVSALFIVFLYGFEKFFETRIKGGYYVQHPLGMLAVGIMMYVMLAYFGHYYVEGVGYATIQDILSGGPFPLYLLVLLFVLKLLATSLTLGSGASGGIFSPALFLGATFGSAYGSVLNHIYPALGISPAGFAVAAMGGAIGGTTGAALAGIIMIYEMTMDYRVIIPMTITVALSYGVRRMCIKDSIYTRKLTLRGHNVPEALQTNFNLLCHARGIMDKHFIVAKGSQSIGQLTSRSSENPGPFLVVTDGGDNIVGFVIQGQCHEIRPFDPNDRLDFLARTDYVLVRPETLFTDILSTLRSSGASVALVVASDSKLASAIQGVITEHRFVESLEEGLNMYR